jgi:hypothetical protein
MINMSKSQITRVELEQALKRVLSGETTRVAPTRKVSVLAVEEEAGLANGSAYYYKDIIQKIKDSAIQNSPNIKNKNVYESKIYRLRKHLHKEKKLKEKYLEQVRKLKDQLSNMASQHNKLALMVQQYHLAESRAEITRQKPPE